MRQRIAAIAVRSTVLLGLCLTATSSVPAASLDLTHVPAAAKWVAHLDVEGFLASAAGRFVLKEMEKPDRQAGLTVLKNLTGVDLTRDLRSITVYGSDPGEEQNVALIEGRFESDKLLALLRTNPTLKQVRYGGRTLYEWTDDPEQDVPGPQRFGTFYDDNHIVIAGARALLDQAIALLDGEGNNLASSVANRAEKVVLKPSRGAYLGLYVHQLPTMPRDDPGAALLAKIANGRMEMGERDGNQSIQLTLNTVDKRTAGNLARMADGFLAFVDLVKDVRQHGQPVVPPVAERIVEDIRVTVDGTMVQAKLTTPAANVVEALEWMAAQEQRKKAR